MTDRRETLGCLHRGFTLIELLVVISIIALLVSILLPALGKSRATAQSMQCMAKEKQIGVGFANYTAENKSYNPSCMKKGSASANSDYWTNAIFTYMGYSSKQWTQGYNGQLNSNANDSVKGPYLCPVTASLGTKATPKPIGNPPAPTTNYCYGMNTTLPWYRLCELNPEGASNRWAYYVKGNPGGATDLEIERLLDMVRYKIRTTEVPKASSAAWVLEATFVYAGSGEWKSTGSGVGLIPHNNGSNVLFFDGHAGFRSVDTMPAYKGATFLETEDTFWKGK